jgi:hypothetical protein
MLILAYLYGICFYGFRESDEKLTLYGHVDYQPRTGLWNYFSVFYYWWKRKMSFSFMSRNYHHYSNFKWDYQTQGR